ncbi:hypothetical protein JOF29_002731 [Kribbella aluminosa]|uniref:SPFH domain/Band 7 family protein n=1 Tax=Kribbella aluminosa TaxID=416017 RepID=A0ABS4UJ10_9ACTN|nr:hypothetical protein [Kribbella aluminosa]MBP2351648.1 hypothetical protein [Kribbella aluminosa]
MSTPDQSATLNDPILAERDLRRFDFVFSRPSWRSGGALVMISSSGSTASYSAERPPTRGELVIKNFRKLYEIDTGYHHLTYEHELPSDGDAFQFNAVLDVDWRVVDPAVVVRRGVRDVRRLLEPRLLARMRAETRRYAIEESAAAERAVQDALDAMEPIEGIAPSCEVRLSLDTEAIQQHTALRALEHTKVQEIVRHELSRLQALQGQELTEATAQFFARLLEGSDSDRWGLQVAHNPADLPLALEGIREDHREGRRNQVRLFEQLIAKGMLEEHMVDEASQLAVEAIRAGLADSAHGKDRRRPLYREELPRAETPSTEEQDDEG